MDSQFLTVSLLLYITFLTEKNSSNFYHKAHEPPSQRAHKNEQIESLHDIIVVWIHPPPLFEVGELGLCLEFGGKIWGNETKQNGKV